MRIDEMSLESLCVGKLQQVLEVARPGLSRLVIFGEDARHWQLV